MLTKVLLFSALVSFSSVIILTSDSYAVSNIVDMSNYVVNSGSCVNYYELLYYQTDENRYNIDDITSSPCTDSWLRTSYSVSHQGSYLYESVNTYNKGSSIITGLTINQSTFKYMFDNSSSGITMSNGFVPSNSFDLVYDVVLGNVVFNENSFESCIAGTLQANNLKSNLIWPSDNDCEYSLDLQSSSWVDGYETYLIGIYSDGEAGTELEYYDHEHTDTLLADIESNRYLNLHLQFLIRYDKAKSSNSPMYDFLLSTTNSQYPHFCNPRGDLDSIDYCLASYPAHMGEGGAVYQNSFYGIGEYSILAYNSVDISKSTIDNRFDYSQGDFVSISSDVDNSAILDIFKFSITNPFLNLFSLFSDNQCVNLPTLGSWLNVNSTVCTPWASSIRSVLTPVFTISGTMLLWLAVVSWLKNRDSDFIEVSSYTVGYKEK